MTAAQPHRRPPQRERVLRALEAAGPAGVRGTDFLEPNDGGPPILRVASRVTDLRRLGYVITSTRGRNGIALYRLEPRATLFVAAPQHRSPYATEAGA